MSMTEPGRRRRLEDTGEQLYEIPTRPPIIESAFVAGAASAAVVVTWFLATIGSATAVISVGAPEGLWRPSAAVLLVLLAGVLTYRCGGWILVWTPMAAVLAIAAQFGPNFIVVAAAGTTAVLAAVAAVLLTRPAHSILEVLREVGVFLAVALSGTVAVAAWNAPVMVRTFSAVTLVAAMTVMIAIVWNLGTGQHGLEAKQMKIFIGVAAFAVLLAVYGGFVRNYGSPAITEAMEGLVAAIRSNAGGVPRPLQALIGFPALIVGTSLRSQRREGWWVCVFAVIGAVVISTSLVHPAAYPSYFVYSTAYSAAIGLVIGLILRQIFVGGRTPKSGRAVEPRRRVEPNRLAPLQ